MTTVTYYKGTFGLSASGHAGAGKHGEDLVCCSVSTLMYCLVEALHKEKIVSFNMIKDGLFDVCAYPSITQKKTASVIFSTIASGLEHLSLQYPDKVQFIRKGDK